MDRWKTYNKTQVVWRLFSCHRHTASTIKPLNIGPNKHMTSSSLKMSVRDDLSGVKTYRAEIDGEWVLMEFDPKKARLTHYFNKSLQKGEHTFTLEIIDDRENSAHYEVRFSR